MNPWPLHIFTTVCMMSTGSCWYRKSYVLKAIEMTTVFKFHFNVDLSYETFFVLYSLSSRRIGQFILLLSIMYMSSIFSSCPILRRRMYSSFRILWLSCPLRQIMRSFQAPVTGGQNMRFNKQWVYLCRYRISRALSINHPWRLLPIKYLSI